MEELQISDLGFSGVGSKSHPPPPKSRIFFEAKIEILKANFKLFFVILEVNSGKIKKICGF